MKSRGFTLIELLVVIAIIGILSSVVLASLNTARAKARDATRKSDLHEIQTALELYANDHDGSYPPQSSTIIYNDLTALAPTYIPSLPDDPVHSGNSSSNYRYSTATGNGAYTILAHLEGTNNWCSLSTGSDQSSWAVIYPHC